MGSLNFPRRAAAAGAAWGQQRQRAGGCGGAARPLPIKGLLLGVYGTPKLAPGSKELAPEGREAVKTLHAGLLLQGQPPASTRKGRRLWERGVVAPDWKTASEARRYRTNGPEIEGAGAREAWSR